ncbi:MAG: ABC transporter permease subunit [Nannocystaceae bacterium]|nr:ABC transporter permease subunit [Nannocystaceae bacterium]
MKWRHVWVVLRKELRDGLRDRRSLFSALVFPLIGPVLVVVMFRFIAQQQAIDEPVPLPVIGAEHAPGLVEYLRQHDIDVREPPADAGEAVRTGEAPAVLVIPADYGDRFRASRSVRVELMVDNSRNETRSKVRRARRVLEAYAAGIGAQRLLLRGIDPQIAAPVAVAEVDLATAQQLAANVLNVIPMFVMMAAFIGGMYVATDSTAGERERGSLEPLLANPVSRTALVLGKWLATATLSGTSLLLTLVTAGVALSRAPLEELGVQASFGLDQAAVVCLVMLPVALLAAGLQLVVATFARSFREAQTYLSVLTLAPMLPGVMLTVMPLDQARWTLVVPILGQQQVLMDVIRGDAIGPAQLLVPSVIVLVLGLVCVRATAWLFGRERIVFGG